ncbi:MAG: hypothetical protein NTY64_14690, partial [Deltaproteobacteria bacterium]|nr:hypothetical protein [Deltaproteobacteria bacterium]
ILHSAFLILHSVDESDESPALFNPADQARGRRHRARVIIHRLYEGAHQSSPSRPKAAQIMPVRV